MNQLKTKPIAAAHCELPNVIKYQPRQNSVVATNEIQAAVDRLSELKRQETTLKKLIEAERAIIEGYMNDATELLDSRGNELVTWRYDNDREDLDKKALKLNFADVYYACTITVAGTRKFLIKG